MSVGEAESVSIVVTGASGRVGRALIHDLSTRGHRVRALTREPGKQPTVPGVEWAYADLLVPSTLPKALQGARALFLLTSPGVRMVEEQTNAISAAAQGGVEHVVKQSALGASDHSRSTVARWHHEVERTLLASGLAWTILRPHYFMDNLLAEAETLRSTGELRSPVGPGRVPFIDTADIGAVAAEVVATSKYRGEKMVLTGGAALSYLEVASAMSETFDRPIRYLEESLDEARGRLASRGTPPWEVDSTVALWGYQRAGGPTSEVSPEVQRVLGRAPRSIREFLEAHRQDFGFGPIARSNPGSAGPHPPGSRHP